MQHVCKSITIKSIGYQKLKESLFPCSADIYFTSLEIPLGISEDNTQTDFSLEVYPNPVMDKVTIELNIGNQSNVAIKILDVSGKLNRAC